MMIDKYGPSDCVASFSTTRVYNCPNESKARQAARYAVMGDLKGDHTYKSVMARIHKETRYKPD